VHTRYLNQREVDLQRMVAAPAITISSAGRVEIEPEGFSAEWRGALERNIMWCRLRAANGQYAGAFKSRTGGAAQAASDPRGQDIVGISDCDLIGLS